MYSGSLYKYVFSLLICLLYYSPAVIVRLVFSAFGVGIQIEGHPDIQSFFTVLCSYFCRVSFAPITGRHIRSRYDRGTNMVRRRSVGKGYYFCKYISFFDILGYVSKSVEMRTAVKVPLMWVVVATVNDAYSIFP